MKSTLSPSTLSVVFNALSFQCIWWLGVLYQNQFIIISILLVLLHFVVSKNRKRDFWVVLAVSSLGIFVDICLIYFGVFEFSISPWWLALLWIFFALTLNSSLAFAHKLHLPLQVILGGISGSLSYLAGANFGAVVLPFGTVYSTCILVVIWCVLFPVSMTIAARLKSSLTIANHV
ncbi:DUF2878 domain-containing protein [Shewanella holmiensis]|uniref:DUF2878 domain-containing protein n=1 Tax=Shewanella holmiensis TaxID=2952222 RepID=A0A9X3AU05_9GAMM|nr:DUF2878 domain-containing protein [Shewanella holmiensis]MCT7941030.1 DUF2878 domain-containing protein [Shewanella holmiensis]